MGSSPDLALGCRAAHVPMAVGNGFMNTPPTRDKVERVHILDEYLKALEDERRKIEAFKRELPHCMQLLDYAIDASKEHLVHSPPCSPGRPFSSIGKKASNLGLFGKEMIGEFLKTRWESARREDSEEELKKARRSSSSAEGDRPTWMAEAQLWSQPPFRPDQWKEKESSTEDSVRRKKDPAEQSAVTSPGLFFNSKQRPGGAFVPFVKEKPAPNHVVVRSKPTVTDFMRSTEESRPTPHGLLAVESEVGSVEVVSTRTRDMSMDVCQGKEAGGRLQSGGNYSGGTGSTTSGGGNAQRKARRCWSPELHRRFVSALQNLGGSQIATPKQIRELMKVEGLTNDEVKSHLQKYRLHTRRPSPTPQVPPQTTPQLVVLGGIWVPPEYGNVGVYHDPSSSVSQRDPPFCQPSQSQEFYSQLHPSVQIELHRSPSQSSPQGPLQSASYMSSGAHQVSGELYREDSIGEDGKSESSSWKGENNLQGSSEKEETSRKHDKDSEDEDEEEDDMDDADNEKDSGMRLQLEMSCSSAHSIKTEPQLA